jgi:hypothetical protein
MMILKATSILEGINQGEHGSSLYIIHFSGIARQVMLEVTLFVTFVFL